MFTVDYGALLPETYSGQYVDEDENALTGTVEYLGYLFTYTYEYLSEDGVTYITSAPRTIMFVVEADEDGTGLRRLVEHDHTAHILPEEGEIWGAWETVTDEDGESELVLLWKWEVLDSDGVVVGIRYYARCRYDGQYQLVFETPAGEEGTINSDGYYVVNGDESDYAES